jgi:outer membrane protein assembly factor BamA
MRLSLGRSIVALAIAVAAPVRAGAQVDGFLGQPVTSVSVVLSGQALTDPQVLGLVDTRVGQPLAMVNVRKAITALMTLGRYDDVVVDATLGSRGVDLVYRLSPARIVTAVDFTGRVVLDRDRLRGALGERFGHVPRPADLPEMQAVLRDLYRGDGYFNASVRADLEAPRPDGRARIVFTIDAGARARVGAIDVSGDAPSPPDALLRDLGLAAGKPWDATGLQRRIDRWVTKQHPAGFYEAAIAVQSEPRPDGNTVDLRLTVTRGPAVDLVFEGDPLPKDKQRELVPISREGTVDEDLLEDAKRRIEDYLLRDGYWRARVDFVRAQKDGRLQIVFTVSRGARYVVLDVAVEGTTAVPQAELIALVRTRPGAPFVEATLDEDVRAIAQTYQLRGFGAAKVTRAVTGGTAVDAAGIARVSVRILVDEGPLARVASVGVRGWSAVSEEELRRVLKLTPGAPYYPEQVLADGEALRQLYLNRGYLDVRVEEETARAGDGPDIAVTYAVAEGVQALIEHIVVVGNARTDTQTILRELQLEAGAPVNLEALADAQRRLAALGLFRRVQVEQRAVPGDTTRDVVVTVDEAAATTIGYGGGVEVGRRLVQQENGAAEEQIDVAPRAFFEVGRRNLWGKNRSVSLFSRVSLKRSNEDQAADEPGTFGFNEYRLLGTYREPGVFGWNADAQVTGFLEQAIRTSFSYRRRGVTATMTRRTTGPWTYIGGYSFGHQTTFDEQYNPSDQPLIDRLFPQVRLSILSGILVRSTRNDALDPERGTFLTLDTSLAARALGSEVGYVKTLGELFAYRRLPGRRRLVFAGGVRLGLAAGFERAVPVVDEDGNPVTGPDGQPLEQVVDDLPAAERFYAGGATTVRGFSQDRLGDTGTIDQDGFPTGGNGLVVLNAELRVAVWRSVGAAAFVDSGNVFLRVPDIDFGRLRTTVGGGLRYRSPFGPLRVDVGFKLDRQVSANGTSERPYVVYVSLGEAF